MSDEPRTPVSNGVRLHDGTFGKGNTFGRASSPYMRRLGQLRGKLLDCTTEDDIEQLIAMLRQKSLEGDVAAARLWLEYALGKPQQALALSGPDGEPLGGDGVELRAVILGVLAKHPAARIEVAAALMRLREGGDDGRSHEPGD